MVIRGFDHFVLTVSDLTKAVDFYHTVLGLPIASREHEADGAVTLRCGNMLLRLRTPANASGSIVANNLQTGCFDFCLESPLTSEEICRDITAHNVSIEAGPVTRHGARGAMTSVYVRDPDGNLVEIATYQH